MRQRLFLQINLQSNLLKCASFYGGKGRLSIKTGEKLARSFNFTFRYIDDVFSNDNTKFEDFVDRIYPIELEIKDTTDTDRYASYFGLHLGIDSGGRFRTKHYDKR